MDGVSGAPADETFITPQKFSMVTKSLESGLMNRVNFYQPDFLIVIK